MSNNEKINNLSRLVFLYLKKNDMIWCLPWIIINFDTKAFVQ